MSNLLDQHGIKHTGTIHWNLGAPQLTEHAVRRGEALLAANGALISRTGRHTGRSPQDKFIVDEESSREHIAWGNINRPFEVAKFDRLHDRILAYLQGRELFVQDCGAGADPRYGLKVRVITELAWHNLFARQLFLRLPALAGPQDPEFTVLCAPGFKADPAVDGTRSDAFIILNLARRMVIIGGTQYAGEMKKSVFSTLNYLLPLRGVLPMHCSANVGPGGEVALFFGLSGTGKTTLSADPNRRLIGDDEHGWSDDGVFNFEGGCYAKCIRLSEQNEPQIWSAIRFGSVLENVAYDAQRGLNYDDASITENTRAAYPVDYIPGAVIPGVGGHPTNVVFLSADAFGVLPPISRLSPEQAMFYFLSGYTAKVAGTEAGLGSEPQATFSTCFGAPFLPLKPSVYAGMLGEKLRRHGSKVWLLNTGWNGTGKRMHLPYTRAMATAALTGKLDHVRMAVDPVFGVEVPTECPEVPAEVLDPRKSWADLAAYEEKARDLSSRFHKNFQNFDVDAKIGESGPRQAVSA